MSDLEMFRQHLLQLRKNELSVAHGLALQSNPAVFTRISAGHQCVELIDMLLADLKVLETQPGVFAKRIGLKVRDE